MITLAAWWSSQPENQNKHLKTWKKSLSPLTCALWSPTFKLPLKIKSLGDWRGDSVVISTGFSC